MMMNDDDNNMLRQWLKSLDELCSRKWSQTLDTIFVADVRQPSNFE